MKKSELKRLKQLAKQLPPVVEEIEELRITGGVEAQELYDKAIMEGKVQKPVTFNPSLYYKIPIKIKQPRNHYRVMKKLWERSGVDAVAKYLETLNVKINVRTVSAQ